MSLYYAILTHSFNKEKYSFLLSFHSSIRDSGAKWFSLCFPRIKGLMRSWKLLIEKLKILGVGLKEGTVKKITEKRAPPTMLKKKSSSETKSFAEAVVGTKHKASTDAVRVSVEEEEIT